MKFNLNEYLYNIGDELNGLKIIDKTRLNNQKAYEVQSLTYPDAPTYKTTELQERNYIGNMWNRRLL